MKDQKTRGENEELHEKVETNERDDPVTNEKHRITNRHVKSVYDRPASYIKKYCQMRDVISHKIDPK